MAPNHTKIPRFVSMLRPGVSYDFMELLTAKREKNHATSMTQTHGILHSTTHKLYELAMAVYYRIW